MYYINENDVLDYYIKLLKEEKISFFSGKTQVTEKLIVDLDGLRKEREMHSRIEVAKSVWKSLFSHALSSLSPNKNGYDDLFKYFDTYVAFEELIFASDSFYRDHTLHCLWVYFLGEYLCHEKRFEPVFNRQSNIYNILNDLSTTFKSQGFPENTYKGAENFLFQLPDTYVLRCLTALTHDLGYPLKKIKKINSAIQNVLPYFGIERYSEFDFQYSETHMPLVREMISFMSLDINFTIHSEVHSKDGHRETFQKYLLFSKGGSVISLNPSIYNYTKAEVEQDWNHKIWKTTLIPSKKTNIRYTYDFEKYQHGMMSAYILFRHLDVFRQISIFPTAEGHYSVATENQKMLKTLIMVFNSIADHTSESYKIKDLSDASAILSFLDEIEEFSRISRANQNRQFIDEFCKTSLEYNEGCFEASFVFDNDSLDDLNPEMAFRGRCKRFLKLFDIPNMAEDLHIKVSCIGKLPHNTKTYSIEIKRKFAEIRIDGELQDIPAYLKSAEFFTSEEYRLLGN